MLTGDSISSAQIEQMQREAMTTKFRFTQTAVDELPFTAGGNDRKEYRDSKLPGLVLRVSKTTKTYYLYKRDPNQKGRGGEIKIKLGNTKELTVEGARKRALKYLGNESGVKQARIDESTQTIESLAEMFEEKHVNGKLKPTSQVDYRRQLWKYIVPHWGHRNPRTLTRSEIRSVFEDRSIESPAQANKLLVVLSSMFAFALKRDVVEYNPCEKIEPNKVAKRERILTDDEIVQALTSLNKVEPVKRHYFWLLLLLAQRRTETVMMQWDHFRQKKDVWTIPSTLTKNGLTHSVPLPPLAAAHVAALRERTRQADNCFYSWETRHNRQPGPYDAHYMSTYMTRFRKRFMPASARYTIHDWRRTAATGIATLVKDQSKLKRVLNHIDKSNVTSVYDLYSYDEVKLDCLNRWEDKIRSLMSAEDLRLSLM